jgi:hypothetical protein
LVFFTVIWYIFPVLVCCTKKNLATLAAQAKMNEPTGSEATSGGVLRTNIYNHLMCHTFMTQTGPTQVPLQVGDVQLSRLRRRRAVLLPSNPDTGVTPVAVTSRDVT